jgi:DNA-binding transcriptional regulator YdaS (Cro superfamily)
MRPRIPVFDVAQTALAHAIAVAKGPSRLAAAIGVSSQAISQWKQVPAQRVLQVERATGVPRHMLRPDLYPPTHYAIASEGAAA